MRKFKIVLMSIVCSVVMGLFLTEAFASILVNLNINGDIIYVADEIGADIFGTYKKTGKDSIDNTYLNISGQGTTDTDGIYQIRGSEDSYAAHSSTVGSLNIWSDQDEIIFHVFIKNTGDRLVVPVVEASSPSADVNFSIEKYYFSMADSQTDYIAVKRTSVTAPVLITQLEAEAAGVDYQSFSDNQSLTKNDVFMAKVTITISNVTSVTQYSNFGLTISLYSDISYNNPNILTVRQEQNVVATAWEKVGQNQYLSASAIQGNTNNLALIANAYNGTNTNATLTAINANLTYECDDYDNAAVYKDIDLVNVDIATGELIGYLSDLSYDFEWFGGDVTLPAGTTLASGRTLSASETFTVDVYTYYPTFYIRRWAVPGKNAGGNATTYTYISISDEPFAGSVKIDEFYVSTSEGTMFNPDGSVAHNTNGIILRSYVYGWSPTSGNSSAYLQTYYGFGTYTDSTNATTQEQFLTWQNNLTLDWQTFATNNPTLKTVSKAVGENYRLFAFQYLYLVKYANNNSQTMVGSGNVASRNGIKGGSITNTSHAFNKAPEQTYTIANGNEMSRIEAAKGAGTIGLKGTAGQTTGTTTFNNYGLAFGYNNDGGNTPLYATDFLTYNNGSKRILRDGYIGSDQYTSVACLGRLNPWGNLCTWVCGILSRVASSELVTYIQFDDYDGTNYYLTYTNISETNLFNNYGYTKLGYTLQTVKSTYYRYCGVSSFTTDDPNTNAKLSLIGLPIAGGGTGSATTGLCDIYWAPADNKTYGMFSGGAAHNTTDAGIFYMSVDPPIDISRGDYGFRTMLL